MVIKKKNEVVGLGNVIVIFEIVSKIVQGWPYKERCKINCPRIVVQKFMQNFQYISSSKKIHYWDFLSHKCTTLEFVVI
jgi:hypothetical protein